MATVEEFISMRKSIETLVDQLTLSIKQGMAGSEREQLGRASAQLKELTAMVSNDVQATALDRLTRQLAGLEAKIEAAASKKSSSGRTPSGRTRSQRKQAEKKVEAPLRPAIEEEPVIVIFERP